MSPVRNVRGFGRRREWRRVRIRQAEDGAEQFFAEFGGKDGGDDEHEQVNAHPEKHLLPARDGGEAFDQGGDREADVLGLGAAELARLGEVRSFRPAGEEDERQDGEDGDGKETVRCVSRDFIGRNFIIP